MGGEVSRNDRSSAERVSIGERSETCRSCRAWTGLARVRSATALLTRDHQPVNKAGHRSPRARRRCSTCARSLPDVLALRRSHADRGHLRLPLSMKTGQGVRRGSPRAIPAAPTPSSATRTRRRGAWTSIWPAAQSSPSTAAPPRWLQHHRRTAARPAARPRRAFSPICSASSMR